MLFPMRGRGLLRPGLPLLIIGLAGMGSSAARATTTLWYNGDFDLNDAATNENNVPINIGGTYELNTSLVFNNFVVPAGQTWSISSVFSNNQISYPYAAPTTADWQIRSGVSAGNGGTLVASGDTSATVTQTHPADSVNYIEPEFKVAAVVAGVTLTSGTYWVAVAPNSAGYYGDQSYMETTSGANAIGTPPGNDGNSFLFNDLSGPGSLNYVASSLDYSEGVIGAVVPEPAGMLPIMGLAGMSLLTFRRRRVPKALAQAARAQPRRVPTFASDPVTNPAATCATN